MTGINMPVIFNNGYYCCFLTVVGQPLHASAIPPSTSVNGSVILSLLYTSRTGGLNNTTYGKSSYSIFSIWFESAIAASTVFAASN